MEPNSDDSPSYWGNAAAKLGAENVWLLAYLGRTRRALSARANSAHTSKRTVKPDLHALAWTYIQLSELEDALRMMAEIPLSGQYPAWVEQYRER